MKALTLATVVALLVPAALVLTGCGSDPSPAPAPSPAPPDTSPPSAQPSPQPEPPGDSPAPPSSDPSPGPGTSPAPPAPGRTLWSYGAGAPQEGGRITAAAAPSGDIVLGFHEGPWPERSVFTLRRLGPDGRQRWSRTIGAAGCQTLGGVLGVGPGGTIYVDLVSNCASLPGFGNSASGEGGRFALDAEGNYLRAVHFGRDPAVVAPDGTLVAIVRLAPPDVLLFAYGEDGARRWERQGEHADVMRPSGDGGFVLAANRPPPVYPDRPPHVTRYRADGSVAWVRDLPAQFLVDDAVVLEDGTTAVAGSAAVSSSWAGHEVGGLGTPTLLTIDAGGQPRSARNLEGGSPALARLAGGALAVVTRGGCDHLWIYEASLERRWERPLDGGCRTRSVGLVAAPGGPLVAFGAYSGTADLGDGHATTAPGPEDAFAGAFAP